MYAILAAVVGPRVARDLVTVAAASMVLAIQLNRHVHRRLGILEFHFAADDGPRHHAERKSVDGQTPGDGKNRWHLVTCDSSGEQREISVSLNGNRVEPGRNFGKRELPI